MKRIILIIFAINISITSHCQLLQGEWRDHLPFHDFYRIVSTENLVYSASVSGVLIYNKSNGEIQKLTKSSGIKDFLSDVEISTINYSEEYNLLIIGYNNGNLDIMQSDGTIINLPDIKNKSITGTKKINRIDFHNKSAYLACDFGVIELDMEKFEFVGNYYFGEGGSFIQVNDIAFIGNIIYTATSSGVYWANLTNSNLLDYNYWNHISYIPKSNSEYLFVESFNNKLYAAYNATDTFSAKVIVITENNFQEKNFDISEELNDFSSSNGYLCFSGSSKNTIYDENENLYYSFKYGNVQHISIGSDQIIYVASVDKGMYYRTNSNNFKEIVYNSPDYYMVSKIETKGDHLWVSSGSPERKYLLRGLLYYFDNVQWKTYDKSDYPSTISYANTYKIAIDPRDYNHVYVASEAYGLIEFMNGKAIRTFDRYNHDLFAGISNDIVGIRIAGLQFDSHNNLWMVINMMPQPVFKINADGTWENPSVTSSNLTSENLIFTDMIVTKDDDIWITIQKKGIVVLRDNGSGTLLEKSFVVKNNNRGISFDKPICMNEDHDGAIWVGTTTGPVIYSNPSDVFQINDVSGTQVEIPRNDGSGTIDFLLYGETILDIKTDGGNRKWMATEKSGVFLISEDGEKTIYNFREDNTPLLSNNVSGIGIMENSGEVFFATDKGLISYKGVATKGNDNYDNVYVYPNPVRENFEGNITITGLIENSIVKITDVSGNLVYETISIGGQAIWDGKNFNGNRVGTGVYLVFLSTPDGSQSHVTKFLFIH